jgi:hypothetical protein
MTPITGRLLHDINAHAQYLAAGQTVTIARVEDINGAYVTVSNGATTVTLGRTATVSVIIQPARDVTPIDVGD